MKCSNNVVSVKMFLEVD